MKIGDVQGRLLKARRAEASEAMEEILNTSGGDGPFFYEDDEVQLNNSYRYKIKAVFLDGKNSQLSNPFTVLY
jgi:hypothetical protein